MPTWFRHGRHGHGGAWHPAQGKQKSHFVKSDPIYKNVYVFTEKPMQKLIANIPQISRDVNTQFWRNFTIKLVRKCSVFLCENVHVSAQSGDLDNGCFQGGI